MLVITRKPGEELLIGDPKKPVGRIRICKVGTCGRVSIGITLPRSIPVHRAEIADRIPEDEKGASRG